jgi:hypothetical protein
MKENFNIVYIPDILREGRQNITAKRVALFD